MFGLNALFAFGGAALGRRLDPYHGFNFLVEIDGLLTGGFQKVSGLGSSIATEQHFEGGDLQGPHALLGHTTWEPISLERGLIEIDTLWNWYAATARGVIKRKNGSIIMLDRRQIPVTQWVFKDAIPTRWTGPGFDSGASQLAIERIELTHRGLEKPTWMQIAGMARATARMITGKEGL
jgi:phage tail-like protein